MAIPLLSASAAASPPDSAIVQGALGFFAGGSPTAVVERLEAIRPAPVTWSERQDVLATLPPEGDVRRLDATQRNKLAAARRVLELHGREGVYVIKVIDVPQAAVGLHGRTVVLVSEPALDLLDQQEIQALVAHEVGHEYFWDEYARARRDDDRRRLRTLELLCDGVALVTLRRAGLDPQRLSTALEKIVRYNRERFRAARNEDDYPTIEERRAFARRLVLSLGLALPRH